MTDEATNETMSDATNDSEESEAAVERIDKLDDLEISVHHTVRLQHRTHRWEYEVHAGMADVLEIPKPLAEMAKTVIGVDLERDNIESAAEIRVIEDA